MSRTDFLLGSDGDLQIENGDFVTGQSDEQNVALILAVNKGAFKQFPLVGVGIKRYINGKLDSQLERQIRLQLAADGYSVKAIGLDNNDELNIDYETSNS